MYSRELEEELEYFEFLPSDFFSEALKRVCEALLPLVQEPSMNPQETKQEKIPDQEAEKKRQWENKRRESTRGRIDQLEAVIERNMLIFERFTLRNIFTFPESFVYSRKPTDKLPEPPEVTRDLLLSVQLKKEKKKALQQSILQKKRALSVLQKRLLEVSNIPPLSQIISGLSHLNTLMRHARDTRSKCITANSGERSTKKELEEEILGRESMELKNRIPLGVLQVINWKPEKTVCYGK